MVRVTQMQELKVENDTMQQELLRLRMIVKKGFEAQPISTN